MSVDDYKRSLSFLSEACNGIKSVDGLRKLSQLFVPLQTNCGWRAFLAFVKIVLKYLSSLKQHAMVGEWLICSERGIPQYYQLLKRLQIPGNEATTVPDINDDMAAGYDRKVYIGKVLKIDYSDATISFYEHVGTLSIGSIFCEPKKRD